MKQVTAKWIDGLQFAATIRGTAAIATSYRIEEAP